MEIQEFVEISLFPGQLTAAGIGQIEKKTEGTDIKIHECLFVLRPHQFSLTGLVHDGIRDWLLFIISQVDVPDIFLLLQVHDIDPENIKFISITDKLAEKLLPRRQIRAQLICIMLTDSHANDIILTGIIQKIADMAAFK